MKATLPTILKTAFPQSTAEQIREGCERVRDRLLVEGGRIKKTIGVADYNIRGQIKTFVVENGKVVKEYPIQKNLILNRFMEDLYDRNFEDMFNFAVASVGTTATTFDSGTTEASQTGTTVTINTSTGAFTFDDTFNHSGSCVGNVIKWDSGEERRIVSRTSSTVVEVTANPNGNVVQGPFTVYGTNQTRMATNTAGNEERSGPAIAGTSYVSGDCGTQVNTSTGEITFFRTFDFAIRADGNRGAASTPYKEVGFSEIGTVGGTTINSRIVLSTPVAVELGQQLRIEYDLIVTVSPITPETIATNPITGWTSAGKQQIQLAMFENILAAGTTSASGRPLDPQYITANQVCASLTTVATAHNAFNTNGPDRSAGAASLQTDSTLTKSTKQTYGTVSEVHRLSLDKQASWAAATGNGTWQAICLGQQNTAVLGCLTAAHQAFVYIMDIPQVKDSIHSLDINFRFTWSRTLS